ncbi:MAG: hypothetical protein L3J71_07260 [Victivallaceae bacterium]|nr:hypothetical protein [Victivallaceae bacterium]
MQNTADKKGYITIKSAIISAKQDNYEHTLQTYKDNENILLEQSESFWELAFSLDAGGRIIENDLLIPTVAFTNVCTANLLSNTERYDMFGIFLNLMLKHKMYKIVIVLLDKLIDLIKEKKKNTSAYEFRDFTDDMFYNMPKQFTSEEELFEHIVNNHDLTPYKMGVIAWFYTLVNKRKGVDLALKAIKKEPDNPILYHWLMDHMRILLAAWEAEANDPLPGIWDEDIFKNINETIYYKRIGEICDIFDYAVKNYPDNKDAFIKPPDNSNLAYVDHPNNSNHIYYFDFIIFFRPYEDYRKIIHCCKMGEYLETPSINIYKTMGNCYSHLGEYKNTVTAYKQSIECGEQSHCYTLDKMSDAKIALVHIFLKMNKCNDAVNVINEIFDYNEYLNKDIKNYGQRDLCFSEYIFIIALNKFIEGDKKTAKDILVKYREHYEKTLLKRAHFLVRTVFQTDNSFMFLLSVDIEFMLFALEIVFDVICDEQLQSLVKSINTKKFNSSNILSQKRVFNLIIPDIEVESIDYICKRDGESLFLNRFRRGLIKYILSHAKLNSLLDRKSLLKQKIFYDMYSAMSINLERQESELAKKKELHSITIEYRHKQEITEAKLAERDKILANLAHSIKNLISSVQTPLQLVAGDSGLGEYNKFSVDNALKGLELIKRLAFSVDHSYTGAFEDFIFDAKCGVDEGQSIEELILQALIYTTGNMFDRKYFEKPSFRYFPKGQKTQRLAAKKAYNENINNLAIESIATMLNSHFFNFSFDFDATVQNRLNDTKSSATKFFIMLQEIIMNAVKYASFTPREERFIAIEVKTVDDRVNIIVRNSMKAASREKTTGMGQVVIANIAKMLKGECKMGKTADENIFETKVSFSNLWSSEALCYQHSAANELLNVAETQQEYIK